MKTIRIGSGAGTAADRLDPALDLIENGGIQYIGFECMAERTIAFAQLEKKRQPDKGYNELLEYRFRRILKPCAQTGVKVITNMGAANPRSAARVVAGIAGELGLRGLKIAYVEGDDVFPRIAGYYGLATMEDGYPLGDLRDKLVSANAYTGVRGIVQALQGGADIVITGRVSDPALFMAPMIHEFGWDTADYDLMGKATLVGHLLECAAQATGGYSADPGYKDVPDMWKLGYPLAEVDEAGGAVITKTATSGGCVTPQIVKEQVLYEIMDPANYLTPDCTADFSGVTVEEAGKDRVRVAGATGKAPNGKYKCSCGYSDGYISEGEASYGGLGALARARLAEATIKKRLEVQGVRCREFHSGIIGYNSLFGEALTAANTAAEPLEVRLRIAGRTDTWDDAFAVAYEAEGLWCSGPASGGGIRHNIREVLSIASILVDASDITTQVYFEEV